MGYEGGKTILDDYLREVRPLFRRAADAFSARSTGRARSASSICGSPSAEIPVGHGQTRKGWVVVACLGYSRAGAGALIFSKQTPDLLYGIGRCLWRWAGCRRRWCGIARRRCTPAAAARRPRSPRFCGHLQVGWHFCEPRDPQAKGVVERLQGYLETSFEPGRAFANELDFQSSSTPGSMSAPTRAPPHVCAAGRSIGWPRSSR